MVSLYMCFLMSAMSAAFLLPFLPLRKVGSSESGPWCLWWKDTGATLFVHTYLVTISHSLHLTWWMSGLPGGCFLLESQQNLRSKSSVLRSSKLPGVLHHSASPKVSVMAVVSQAQESLGHFPRSFCFFPPVSQLPGDGTCSVFTSSTLALTRV